MSFNWTLDERKFLTDAEVSRLRRALEGASREALTSLAGDRIPVRDWMIVDLALSTGLRVQELKDLKVGDLFLEGPQNSLLVRRGKGGRSRLVRFPPTCKAHLKDYLSWKNSAGEGILPDSPLFASPRTGGHFSKRSLQYAFERSARLAGLDGHSIHHLRHTHASHLYRASRYNLRLVQKQLGHSSSRVTEVYTDVLSPDLDKAFQKLFSP